MKNRYIQLAVGLSLTLASMQAMSGTVRTQDCDLELEFPDCKKWSCAGTVTETNSFGQSKKDKVTVSILLDASRSRDCYLILDPGMYQAGDSIEVNSSLQKFQGENLTVVVIRKSD